MGNNTSTKVTSTNNNSSNKIRLSRFYNLLLYFLLFSFLGWVLETFYSIYELGHFTNRGFLYGPLCPIYGWGALILIMFFTKYKGKSLKLFIFAAIIFSVFEYAVSYSMDALFATKWWDYSNEFFNLNGRISIFYSFVWGIAAILFINNIYPFFKKKINIVLSKTPYKLQIFVLHFLFVILIIDTVMSFAHNLV